MAKARPLWESLVVEPEERVLPWLGGRRVNERERAWQIAGPLPQEHGWYRFRVSGRRAELVAQDAAPDDLEVGQRVHVGYLVGDRLVPDGIAARADDGYLDGLVGATRRVWLVPRGLGRFVRVLAIEDRDGALVFVREELGLGPEHEVEAALIEGRTSLDHVAGVLPALDLAFRWHVRQRQRVIEVRARAAREAAEAAAREAREVAAQEARAERERRREEANEERYRGGAGRRRLVQQDVELGAAAALELSGAQLLDVYAAPGADELVVSYRFRGMGLQCLVHAQTLRVIDAGVCLDGGDAHFTLESLPGVVGQAMDEGRLVVWRHVDGA